MKLHIAPLVLVAALAACGKSENKGGEAVGTVAAPATVAPLEIDGPAPGKWRLTTMMHGQAMPPVEVCYDHKISFEEAQAMQKQAGVTCSENTYRRDGASVVGHSVCMMDKTKMTTDTRITGDFSSAYTMDITSSMDPAPMPAMAHSEMQIKAERIGDCAK